MMNKFFKKLAILTILMGIIWYVSIFAAEKGYIGYLTGFIFYIPFLIFLAMWIMTYEKMKRNLGSKKLRDSK